MTEKQKTAVQWLMERIRERQALAEHGSKPSFKPLFDKALVMEREQIEEAYDQGIEATFQFHYSDGQQYFTDTYQTEP